MSWREASYLAWGLVVVAFIGLQVLSRWTTRVDALGQVVRRLTSHAALRAALVVAWMWLGWHAFAR